MIREATPTDEIDDLYVLWRELMQQHQAHHAVFKVESNSDQLLQNALLTRLKVKDTRVFVYETDLELAGMLVVSIRRSAPGFKLATKGYIAETIVKAKYRGAGIGKKLVDAAKKWLLDHGADHIELQVSAKNTEAARFWEAQGFAIATQHMVLPLK